jgi:hypothetical protein
MKTKVLGIAAAALLAAGTASAHHSFAMFDYNKDITVVGEVKELQWTNPHIHIYLNVPDGKGGIAEYDIEGGTPNNLRRQGWVKDGIKTGEKLSIVIHPLKSGKPGGSLVRASYADGKPIGNPAAGGA